MREQLIRYLLGELDEDERREVRALLRENPELQQELAHLRECFSANQDDDFVPPPPGGLAERITDTISNSDEYELEQLARAKKMSAPSEPPVGFLGWSLADLTVAGGVVIAVSMLLFPAIRESREGTRRTVCEHNQSQVGFTLAQYTENNNGYLPPIGPRENAGMFVVRLLKKGHVQPVQLQEWLVCPSSPVANNFRTVVRLIIPTADQLEKMSPRGEAELAAIINPCYAVPIPYRNEDREYCYLRNQRSEYVPVFSDASTEPGGAIALNHGGLFIQVLYQDGHVKTHTNTVRLDHGDNIFRNNRGDVAVGDGPNDVVLARCNVKPDPDGDEPAPSE
jgi:prepilin-type processing-associated H-X9-DG protein